MTTVGASSDDWRHPCRNYALQLYYKLVKTDDTSQSENIDEAFAPALVLSIALFGRFLGISYGES